MCNWDVVKIAFIQDIQNKVKVVPRNLHLVLRFHFIGDCFQQNHKAETMHKKIESRRANSNNTGPIAGTHFASPSPPAATQIEQSRQNGSPTQSLNNIQKISARLRARNPVVMSMTTSPQMLLPINQRNMSPVSYNQLSASQEQQRGNSMHQNPLSVGSQNFPNQNFQSLKATAIQKIASSVSSPTNGDSSPRDLNNTRKILHKSMIHSGVQNKNAATLDSSQLIQFDQRVSLNQKPEGRNHGQLNMSANLISQRTPGSGVQDLSGVTGNMLQNSERNMQSIEPTANGVSLKGKISGQHRKRNAREKSYDLYNQKLQLPPMIKPSHDSSQTPSGNNKQDRTYSLPSAGQVHQSMPMSPNSLAMTSFNSPKYNTQIVPQRQSINDAIKQQVPSGTQRFTYQSMTMQQTNSQNPDQANQSNLVVNQSRQRSTQQGIVNLSSMKGFFNARGQGNRSMDKNGSSIATNDIQKPTQPPQSNQNNRSNGFAQSQQMQAVISPRRPAMPQQNSQIPSVRQSQQRNIASSNGIHGASSLAGTESSTGQQAASPRAQKMSSNTLPFNDSGVRASNAVHPAHQQRDHARTEQSQDSNTTKTGSFSSGFDDESKNGSLSSGGSQNGDSNIQFVEVQTLLFGENPPVLNPKTIFLKNHEPTKASQKKCGFIKSYAANTNQGIIREYNEDRVSIILNILKPKSKATLNVEWPQICFFGVFDGHGGAACADYLRDNLHNFVVQNENFPQFPQEAIMAGFKECEKSFLNLVEVAQSRAQHAMPGQQVGPERSGSCACVVMIINDTAYVVNVGDSRCIMSLDAGANIAVLSRDHKPDDDQERIRIQASGGKVYRTQTFAKAAANPDEKDLYVQGPLRVFPGRLSVSRTFGDIEAKRAKYGGNANVIVCEPEIKMFKLKDNFDFFLIGCDGIFERLDNKQCIDAVWDRIQDQVNTKTYDQISPQGNANKFNKKYPAAQRNPSSQQQFHYDEHTAAAEGVEIVLREAAASRSLDNITVVILGLKNLKKTIKKLFDGQTIQQVRQQNLAEQRGVKHTYAQDFEYLEVNEQDLHFLSDPEVASANSQENAVTIEADNKKKKVDAASPLSQGGKKATLADTSARKVV